MEDLVLSEKDSVVTNILKIIEFVKQVEREHGLSEKEINIKYTYGRCKDLADEIIDTLVRLFGNINNLEVRRFMGKEMTHYCVKYTERRKEYCFDILGKKTFDEAYNFVEDGSYWDEKADKELIRNVFLTDKRKIDYVQKSCYEYIKTKSLTV